MVKRIIALFLTATICAVNALAQGDRNVCLELSHPDGFYTRGDTVSVFAHATGTFNADSTILSVLLDGKKVSSTPVSLENGVSHVYKAVFHEPKSVIVRVGIRDSKIPLASVGAVVAPEAFTPSLEDPTGFMAYWKKQLRALRKSKISATLSGQDLELSMPEGPSVHGILAMPEGLQKKSAPAVLYLHGAGVKKPSNRARIEHIEKYVRAGAIALDINAHGFLNDQPQAYYDSLAAGPLNKYSQRPLTTREEYYFRLMILRAVRALDFLCTLPEWDGKNLIVIGSSQGGYQAICAAALDRRVSLLYTIVPAHTGRGASRNGWAETWPYNYSESDILPYFDGANFFRHVRCKVVAEAGLVDTVCPPGCVLGGFNVCPSKDKTVFAYPYRSHKETDMPAACYQEYRGRIIAHRDSILFKALQTKYTFGEIRHDRKDDLCWENEYSGYRAFGPGVQANGEKSFGFDVFTKSVPYPVLHERYNLNLAKGDAYRSFHLDYGDGMDSYAVGPTLGCGTAALVDSSGHIVYPWCWKEAEILENGSRRFQARLSYGPVVVNGREVIEHRLITLDCGSRLNRVDVTFEGLDAPCPIVVGIVVHSENPSGFYADDTVLAVADLGDRNIGKNGEIYCGALLPGGFNHSGFVPLAQPQRSAIGHMLGYSTYIPGTTFTYYFGSGWSKAGIKDMDEWIKLIKQSL